MGIERVLRDWRFAWLLLLLPAALFLPALPIDETRYLSVAWEMRLHGDYLLLHLNGAPYSDKGPLLFWLVNLAWAAAGPSVWIVRLGVLFVSFVSLLLFERLVRRLGSGSDDGNAALARRATVLFAGIVYVALFASAIMFDVLLTACVLLALHGVLDLDQQRWPRGIALFAAGLGLGLLVKGPVVLLDAGTVALLAPWWSETARSAKAKWYGSVLLGMLGGIAIALVWALAAYGVQGFWDAIVLRQTVGRVAKSFAHQRPFWWYLMVLPLMVLPWTLALRAPWRAWRDSLRAPAKTLRFAFAWFVPTFIAFCLVSGKQPHYLLPMLPALALIGGVHLAAGRWRVSAWRAGAVLIIIGLATALGLGRLAAPASGMGAYVCGALVVFTGLLCMSRHARPLPVATIALGMLAALTLCKLAFVLSIGPRYDVGAAAQRIAAAQRAGVPLLYVGAEYGLFTFAGRLTAPIPSMPNRSGVAAWARAHPTGWVISSDDDQPAPPPIYRQRYLDRSLGIWRAADIAAAKGAPH